MKSSPTGEPVGAGSSRDPGRRAQLEANRRDSADTRVRTVSRAVAILATGATVGLGLVVSSEIPGTTAAATTTVSSTTSESTTSAVLSTGSASTGSASAGSTSTGATSGATTAPTTTTTAPSSTTKSATVVSGGTGQ